MYFPKFTLLLNKFRELVGTSSCGSHAVCSFFSLVHVFSVKKNKIRLLLSSRKGVQLTYEMFNAVELFVRLFRLIAGHMPKPMKLSCST